MCWCDGRFCEACAKRRAERMAEVLMRHVAGRTLLHVVLTLQDDGSPLDDRIDLLHDAFLELRRRKVWSSAVVGGAFFLQVTYDTEKETFHPHLHVLAEGEWLEKAKLEAAWKKLTGGSYIVRIQGPTETVQDRERLCRYVCRPGHPPPYPYGVELERNSQYQLTYEKVLRRRRTTGTFGIWCGLSLTDQVRVQAEQPAEEEPDGYPC